MAIFPVWQTIKLGNIYRGELGRALTCANKRIVPPASEMLFRSVWSEVSEGEKSVNLVNVSVKELGFEGGATFGNILERAVDLGLQLCPTEVGPQLCLQHRPPSGETLYIGMKAVLVGGQSYIFCIVNADGCVSAVAGDWLWAECGHHNLFYYDERRFVFVSEFNE